MPEFISVKAQVGAKTAEAVRRALPRDLDAVDPVVRRSERADFQAAVALDLAKRTGRNPRELAGVIKAELDGLEFEGRSDGPYGDLLASTEVSGPGFLNLNVADPALWSVVAARLADDRLGVGVRHAGARILVDYSGPNIAKELHVGHLRSTSIGDALARVLTHAGADVIRVNHLGDWGTQFGRLIQYLVEHPEFFGGTSADATGDPSTPALDGVSLEELDVLYKAATSAFETDPAFAERARNRVVALQAGDPVTRAAWKKLVELSTCAYQDVYERLGVLLTPQDVVPESFYNPMLDGVVAELDRMGLIAESNGALCVFLEEFKDAKGEPFPLIVRKSDGGYGYAATDLAALRYRIKELKAQRILYVIDTRQALHLKMVFATARRAGWLTDEVTVEHVAFGTMLGPGGRPFRSRSGDTPQLSELLDDAVAAAGAALEQRASLLEPAEFDAVVQAAGIGAVKYADLSNLRIKDYVFDPARMVSLNGRTSVYLQYAHARVNSVLGKLSAELKGADADRMPTVNVDVPIEPAERALIFALDEFGGVIEDVAATLEPHRLCTYLFELAKAWSDFWENCPILKADSDAQRENRTALAHLTGRTLRQGLGLLGIHTPRRI
ncbi:arginine--tRNA ligase [Actinospica durhamensis]|uniref:Arginine--tRNA ligase n=1 Tax=Actinospica durhamensis TaxID=1508375 RepID=A0A941IQ48_9ACTN|nr:arginine--tRNA ligase [Actinospica durhamensis]MBR7837255.1 arginine--tRNA ligase [Actinospica durhamensis]